MAAFIREAVGKRILRKEGGSALLVGSIMGYQTTPNMVPLYNVSKTALLGLTKALASELAPMRLVFSLLPCLSVLGKGIV